MVRSPMIVPLPCNEVRPMSEGCALRALYHLRCLEPRAHDGVHRFTPELLPPLAYEPSHTAGPLRRIP